MFARLRERGSQLAYIGLWVTLFAVAGLVSAGATVVPFFRSPHPPVQPAAAEPAVPVRALEAGMRIPAKVIGTRVEPYAGGAYVPMFWAGVNLGSSVPGEEPGAVAAGRGDYDRWLAGMGALGVSVVRVYTILTPAFYDAVRAYDLAHPSRPIYVLHGVWVPEEARFVRTGNAWDPVVTAAEHDEIRDAVTAAYGGGVIPKVPGHAGGVYTSDISPWLMGWSFGIEWDPQAVRSTDARNARMAPFAGTYFRARANASPMESWIAKMMDDLAARQAARGWSVPITFTNWDTTDPLRHPEEPLATEDMVSVDATHIAVTAAWPAGYFASFHAYPYYPDFLRWQPAYRSYRRARDGRVDPYAGYIHELRAHHAGMALMVTEFGQPTSLGCAHLAPLGRDQGCHSETEAAANLVDMMRDLHDEGLAGGVVFTWVDEWFKFTWNTIDYELPAARRALWRNVFTNEEHFGIVAAEPGASDAVVIDGKDAEWRGAGSIGTGSGSVRDVTATSDAENVYLRLTVAPDLWKRKRIVIGLDARPGGNGGLPGLPGVDPGAEMAVVIEPGGEARMSHAAWIDPLAVRFGGFADPGQNYFPQTKASDIVTGSGVWIPLRQILNYPYVIGRSGVHRGTESRDASLLPWGTTDPASPAFDDRNLIDGQGQVLEVALPWGMLSMADPSSHRLYAVHAVPRHDRQVTTIPVSRLGIAVAVDGEPLMRTRGYTWDGWDTVRWHERRKAGWPILRQAYQGYFPPQLRAAR